VSAGESKHPARLLWYACGRLDPGESEAVERHLGTCAACRDELKRLRSMAQSLRAASGEGHPDAAELVAYHDDPSAMLPLDATRVAEHLRACAACGEDLARLSRAAAVARRRFARSAAPAVVAPRSSWTYGARGLLATAALVLVVLTLPPRSPMSTATLVPIRRGPETAVRLVGLGPWRLNVLLPTQAPSAEYEMRIRGVGDPEQTVYDRLGRAGPESSVVLEVPGFPRPGRYVLEMEVNGGVAGSGGTYTYPFDVTRSP